MFLICFESHHSYILLESSLLSKHIEIFFVIDICFLLHFLDTPKLFLFHTILASVFQIQHNHFAISPPPTRSAEIDVSQPFSINAKDQKTRAVSPRVNVMQLSHSDLKLITFRSLFILVILTLRFSTPSRFGYCSSPWTQRLPCPPSSIPVASLH